MNLDVERLWWDLWGAVWQVIAWAESWAESEAKLQCLRLHGPTCDLKGHWFAPWTPPSSRCLVIGYPPRDRNRGP